MNDNNADHQELQRYRQSQISQAVTDAAAEAGSTSPSLVAQMVGHQCEIVDGAVLLAGQNVKDAMPAVREQNPNLFESSTEDEQSKDEQSESLNDRIGKMSVREYREWRRTPEAKKVMAHSQRAESRRRNRNG